MQKKIVLLLAMFIAVSAYAGIQEKILGEWTIDVEKLKEAKFIKEMEKNPAQKPMADMMVEMMANAKITITENELISKMPMPDGTDKVQKEKYTVTSTEGNVIHYTSETTSGVKSTGTFTVVSDKSILNKIDNPKNPIKELYFKR